MTIYINTRIIKECDTTLLDDIDIAVETFSSVSTKCMHSTRSKVYFTKVFRDLHITMLHSSTWKGTQTF